MSSSVRRSSRRTTAVPGTVARTTAASAHVTDQRRTS